MHIGEETLNSSTAKSEVSLRRNLMSRYLVLLAFAAMAQITSVPLERHGLHCAGFIVYNKAVFSNTSVDV